MAIEEISITSTAEYYEFNDLSLEGTDKEGRTITRLNSTQHLPLFLNHIYKPSDEEKKERLFMSRPTDVELIGGYTDQDGLYIEGKISWHNDDSSSSSSKGNDKTAESIPTESSGQSNTSTNKKDSTEK